MDAQTLEREHGLGLVLPRNLTLVSGEGAIVRDDHGREYIDCVAGHGVASLGHAHPRLVNAIEKQTRKLMTCSASFSNPERSHLLAKLAEIAPVSLERSFLCNSGTEAVEAALKFARLATGRSEIICARRSFHGRTLGSLSATFNPHYRRGVEPLVPGFRFVAYNDCHTLEEAVSDRCAAVLLEPIQGEGGIHVADQAFLETARAACDDSGALLILDEVQTGLCRTGRWFACQHFNLVPDILCVAKGLGSGMPIGAAICREDIKPPIGSHGSTFGGNPLACVAALATIKTMQESELDTQVASKGLRLFDRLREIRSPLIRDIRGLGLMVGIDLRTQ
ncbi:MAG: aminotransferase class III-fold pyridoxal phosphate-dependent enzyme, partial [bacterium]|nr:aminotransferase class III-fold pyridoxal phosphate-dependent enzyme [bacterium]